MPKLRGLPCPCGQVLGAEGRGGGGAPAATPPGPGSGGGNGGPGIIVVRGPSALTFTVTPGTNSTSTHPGGDKLATFTVTGTLTVE